MYKQAPPPKKTRKNKPFTTLKIKTSVIVNVANNCIINFDHKLILWSLFLLYTRIILLCYVYQSEIANLLTFAGFVSFYN